MIVETSSIGRSCNKRAGRRPDQQRDPQRFKGGIMKKKYASILLTLICVLGLGVAAEAQYRGEVVVTIPFEFVAGGKTLPAGMYRVSRISQDKSVGLVFSSYENRSNVIVHPVEIESARSDKPGVSFERAGEQHFLSRIQTANDVYNIPVSRSEIREAAARSHDIGSASGSSGSN
jgi:hypothetical protein